MTVPAKLIAFTALLGLAFGGAALAGAAIDPTDPEETAKASHASGDAGHGGSDEGGAPRGSGTPATGGLAVSQGGYTLEPTRTVIAKGRATRFSFRITGPGGRVVRDAFEPEQERELHLIVVRRDTALFQHVHPRRDARGTWSVQLTLPEAGTYRAYADFQIGGRRRTLATDLFSPGDFRPSPAPEPATTGQTGSYDVELVREDAKAGREGRLTFAVSRDGQAVQRLNEYLGAKGHLVALREGDLAYLHVHPMGTGDHAARGEKAQANQVAFAATFPTAGRYRLFFQFRIDGRVRTVAYTTRLGR